MRNRWNYSSYKGSFRKKTAGRLVMKMLIVIGIIAAAALFVIFIFVPFVSDIIAGTDPAERYQEGSNITYRSVTGTGTAEVDTSIDETYIYEVSSDYTMKSDPYYDGDYVIFSTDDNITNGVNLNKVVLYDVRTEECRVLENVTKKYDNIIHTKLSGNYAVWVDCLKDGGGRICGYDLEKNEMFVVKEFGYAIPEYSISGSYIAFMQVSGENEQKIYMYNLETRENVTVKIYENSDIESSHVSLSATSLVWSEYSVSGTAVLKYLDLSTGTAEYTDLGLGEWVFGPKCNGEYIMYTTGRNTLESDLMLSYKGETPVKIATGVVAYEIGDNYAVYSKDQSIYVVSLDKALQSGSISGDMMRAEYSSLNGDNLCFYDITDGFGLIDSVRYLTIAMGRVEYDNVEDQN